MNIIKMKKTKYIFSFILLCLIGVNLIYGQAKITATCKYSKVPLNSAFQVTYTITGGTLSSFVKPSFKNFSVTGSYQSSGGGMTLYVNGKLVQGGDGEATYTYTLVPTAIGKYTIDAAKAKVNGEWIESETITIEVTNSGSTATASSNSKTTKNTTTTSNTEAADNDIFLKASIDKTNPYIGEQVIVTYKLYTRIPVAQYGIDKLPAFTGFWSQDLTKGNDKLVQYSETIGNAKYTVAEIRKVALFPQKSGVLKIEPLNVECIVQVTSKQKNNDPFADFFNDPFFGSSFFNTVSNVEKTLNSNALSINVKALPVSNQPAEFEGSVGKFTLSAEIDKTEAKTNDAIKLSYKITGTGNLYLIEKPDFEFPSDFETYDPDIKENISTTATGISGSKTFSYLLIPRSAGSFTIKPVNFVYFDLSTKNYVTLTSPEFNIKIEKGDNDENTTISSVDKKDIKYLNSDIRYIKTNNSSFTKIGSHFYGSLLFFIMLLLPIVLFTLFVIVYRKKMKENSNIAMVRNKKATGVARKRLKKAGLLLKENQKEPFLDEVFKALWGYVSDKLNIPISELTKDSVSEKFKEKNISEELSLEFLSTLNNCEYARFAPDGGSLTIEQIYNEAINIITKMEKELK